MPRATKSAKTRHDPLLAQLNEDEVEAKYGRISQPGKRKKSRKGTDDENAEVILDPRTSQRIFELAREQQDELEMPEDEPIVASSSRSRTHAIRDDDDDEEEEDDDDDKKMSDVGEDVEEIFVQEIDAGDMDTLDALLPSNSGERRTLADIIFAKIEEGEKGGAAVIQKVQQDLEKPDPALGLDPKVVEAYTKLGIYLHKYTSGALPKIFKVIPTLPAWARMLALTHPENWSPHACRAATRIFISSMKPPQAQLFLSVVLLDAIREDIQDNKKLNVQYYECLKRALYKPGAFFKGIIFPMLDQACSLKEAAIVASILAKTKIPVLHASAALLRIAEMDYSGTYKAKTRGDADKLPVLWHQSLLVFAQRYASDLTPDQKDALLDVIRATPHPQISAEIRRELVNSVVRGAPREAVDQDVDML
ncbi:hypothetical protein C0991_008493 [Blastosporella zonata]|nr:hypothetical protein C0991_008493 [Blastosporella zonata]